MNVRSTFHARYAQLSRNAGKIGSALAAAQEEAITGQQVVRASDATQASNRIQALRASLASQATFQQNGSDAESRLDTADTALGSMSDALAEFHELATQFSNETYNASDRANGAIQAQAIFDQIVAAANTQHAGRSLFAGTATDVEAFAADGTYQGSDLEALSQVSASLEATVGWIGSEGLKDPIDIFESMKAVIDALTADDASGVSDYLNELESARQQVDTLRTRIGVETNLVTDAVELSESAELQITADLSGLTEVDTVESYTRIAELEAALEAALALLAKVGNQSGLFARI
jgi:flagellar hook-associated protein 3 FlgL